MSSDPPSDIADARLPLDSTELASIDSVSRVAPIGIGVIRNRIIRSVNPRMCSILGYSDEELIGHSARMLYADQEEYERVGKVKYSMIAERGFGTLETVWQRKDGALVDIQLSSAPLDPSEPDGAMTYSALDITERKQAERALRESEQRYRSLVDGLPLGVISSDREGRIQDVNQTMLAILGSPSAEATKAINLLSFPPLVDSGISADFKRSIEQRVSLTSEHTYISKWGKRTHLRYHIRPIMDEAGSVRGILAAVEDFTAFKQAEQEKEYLQEQLRHSQKMEAIGQLAGGVAHDFNNVLTGMTVCADTLLSSPHITGEDREDVEAIQDATQRAAELTRQLLAFSRKQLIAPMVLDLNGRVRECSRMLRRTIGEDVELHFTPGKELWPVEVDPGQLDQVLVNLATNARDAMPEGGNLHIATRNVILDQERCQALGEITPGPHIELTVQDDGSGMDVVTRQRIFEPFFSTKQRGQGTGLGLATVYGIIKQHGGAIDVSSAVGRGSVFRIYLPKAKASLGVTEPKQLDRRVADDECILLVEDEDIVRQATERILRRQGFRVLVAANGPAACDTSKRHEGRIHLLLSDVVMPHMNGRQLFERLRESRPDLKVLYISGYAESVIAKHGVLEPLLPKPFSAESLIQAVHEALAQRRP